jgi:hypothetical protein
MSAGGATVLPGGGVSRGKAWHMSPGSGTDASDPGTPTFYGMECHMPANDSQVVVRVTEVPPEVRVVKVRRIV